MMTITTTATITSSCHPIPDICSLPGHPSSHSYDSSASNPIKPRCQRRSLRGPTLCAPAHAAISCSAASPGTAAGSLLDVATPSIDEECLQRQQGQAAICQSSSEEQRAITVGSEVPALVNRPPRGNGHRRPQRPLTQHKGLHGLFRLDLAELAQRGSLASQRQVRRGPGPSISGAPPGRSC